MSNWNVRWFDIVLLLLCGAFGQVGGMIFFFYWLARVLICINIGHGNKTFKWTFADTYPENRKYGA